MKATKHTTEINGLTFTRWNYTGRPSLHERRNGMTTDSINAGSPWTHYLRTAEINSEHKLTGEFTGIEIKVWPVDETIKVEGAERFSSSDADALAKALAAAAAMLDEMVAENRCPRHGTVDAGTDSMGPDCEPCFEEMSAELDEQQRRTQIAANAFAR